MPTTSSSDKPKTKIERIKALALYWSPWPHEFNRLMMKYQISHSFLVTLLYLWQATVGSGDDTCGHLALTQIPVRRKHAEKWLTALCKSGLFKVDKAKLGDQTGSFYEYREDATLKEWERLFYVLAQLELLGGLDDNFTVKKFGQLVASNFKPENKTATQAEGVFPLDDAAKRKAKAAFEAFESATLRKRS